MQLNPLQIVRQFAHVLQQELFPELESSVGPLSGELKLLAAVVSMAPLELMLSARRAVKRSSRAGHRFYGKGRAESSHDA